MGRMKSGVTTNTKVIRRKHGAVSMMVYVEDEDKYFPEDEVPEGKHVLHLSGTELRQRLNEGRDIPAWFTYPEVVRGTASQFSTTS